LKTQAARATKRPTHRSEGGRARLERDALRFLASYEVQLIDFARELVATPSPNPPGDERDVIALSRERLAALGYKNLKSVAIEAARPNLVGEIVGGSPGRVLMLNGHLDTKPAGDRTEWETDPYDPVLRDGHLYGLGAADMKGGVAAMVYAGAALGQLDVPAGSLKIGLTADEEAGSHFGVRFVAHREEFSSDAVLVGEPTGMKSGWAYVAVASRGLSCFVIRVHGTQMHSGLSDQVDSINASVKLAGVLSRMAGEFRPSRTQDGGAGGHVTVNPGVTLKGGVYFGVYPGEAEFGVDIRTVPGMTLSGLKADLEVFLERLRREDPQLVVTAESVAGLDWMPPCSIEPGHALVRAAQSAARDVLGRDVPLGTMPAFTDGSFWAEAGIPCIPAFGPGSLLAAHRPNENVAVEDIVVASRIHALTALRFLSAGAPS